MKKIVPLRSCKTFIRVSTRCTVCLIMESVDHKLYVEEFAFSRLVTGAKSSAVVTIRPAQSRALVDVVSGTLFFLPVSDLGVMSFDANQKDGKIKTYGCGPSIRKQFDDVEKLFKTSESGVMQYVIAETPTPETIKQTRIECLEMIREDRIRDIQKLKAELERINKALTQTEDSLNLVNRLIKEESTK